MIDNILAELKYENKVCKFDRGYSNGIDYGTVVNFTPKTVCIKGYGSDGLYDGIKIFWKNDIEAVLWNGNNLDSRNKFVQKCGLNNDPIKFNIGGFNEFMITAAKEYGYVRINDDKEEESYIGPIIDHDENYIHIENLGNPSRIDRNDVLIAKNRIHSMEVDGIYERNLIELHNSIKT